MPSLEDRYLSGYSVLSRLGRADADGVPVPSPMISAIAPDLWRMIGEACFGVIWNRPGLTIQQRSMATISVIAALRRDDNLKGHVESGLDLGFTPSEIVEMIIQIFFYVGAPIGTTALDVANRVFEERGLTVEPVRVFDPNESPEALLERGRAQRLEILGDLTPAGPEPVDAEWDQYLLEYLWGSVWPRPGLDVQSRMICTLARPPPGRHQPLPPRPRPRRPPHRPHPGASQRAILPPHLLHRRIHRPPRPRHRPRSLLP